MGIFFFFNLATTLLKKKKKEVDVKAVETATGIPEN